MNNQEYELLLILNCLTYTKYYQYDYLMIIKIIFCIIIVIAVIIIKKSGTFIFYKLVIHILYFCKNIMIKCIIVIIIIIIG